MLVVRIWLCILGRISQFGFMPEINDDRELIFGGFNLVRES